MSTTDIEKQNIHLADVSLCYNNIKTLPLSRYTLDRDLLPNKNIQDATVIGWVSNDVQQILPKGVRVCDFNLTKKRIEKKSEESDPSDEFTIIRVVQSEQIYANMYGAIKKLIQDKEELEKTVYEQFTSIIATQQSQIAAMHNAILSLQERLEQAPVPPQEPLAPIIPSNTTTIVASPQDNATVATVATLQQTVATLQQTLATILTKLV